MGTIQTICRLLRFQRPLQQDSDSSIEIPGLNSYLRFRTFVDARDD